MTKRIFAGIILVSLATMLACIGLVMGVMYNYLGDKVDDETVSYTHLLILVFVLAFTALVGCGNGDSEEGSAEGGNKDITVVSSCLLYTSRAVLYSAWEAAQYMWAGMRWMKWLT